MGFGYQKCIGLCYTLSDLISFHFRLRTGDQMSQKVRLPLIFIDYGVIVWISFYFILSQTVVLKRFGDNCFVFRLVLLIYFMFATQHAYLLGCF